MANITPIFFNETKILGINKPSSQILVISKQLVSIIKDKIVSYLEGHSLIMDTERGFRNKRACLSNLMIFKNELFLVYDAAEALRVIFGDFRKALMIFHIIKLYKIK